MWQYLYLILSEYGRLREIRFDPFSQFTLLCACLADSDTATERARASRAPGGCMSMWGSSRDDLTTPPARAAGGEPRAGIVGEWQSAHISDVP